MKKDRFREELSNFNNDYLAFKLAHPEIFKRTRRKPREDDGRRRYGESDDMAFLDRYRKLGCNQSALAREYGISQPAARKRLIRVQRESAESAQKLLDSLVFMGVLSPPDGE